MALKNKYLRAIVMYEFHKRIKIVNAVKNIRDAFGVVVSIRTCKKWYANFKRNNFDMETLF